MKHRVKNLAPAIYNDPTGEYSIKVITHDDGTMELRIIAIGYLEGELSKKINDEFHVSYPSGYQDQGTYYDKTGKKWTITVQIDMSMDTYNPKKGSVVHADCLPTSSNLEEAPIGGFEVCAAGHAGLALHGIWHNIGGDDCYQGDGLMDNPSIPLTDFFQIGYHFIDLVPENLNNVENTKNQSITDYIQSQGTDFEYSNVYQGQVPFAWDGSFERNNMGSLQDLKKLQMDKHMEAYFPDTCNPPAREEQSIEYKPGEPVNN